MDQASSDAFEKYQAEYKKDPKSKVFAPLANTYRKMGLLNQALQIAKDGLIFHKMFASGKIVLGQIYLDMGNLEKALAELSAAVEIQPENILGQKLLASCYLKTKQTKRALNAYKMVLFLRPTDKDALDRIKKLESLTAEEFSDESFRFKSLKTKETKGETDQLALERALSLADALLVRSEFKRSLEILQQARIDFGDESEILKRLKLINNNISPFTSTDQPPPSEAIENASEMNTAPQLSRKKLYLEENLNYLNSLKKLISERRKKQ